MGKMIYNQFMPDYVSPPGDTLLENIEYLGISQAELAKRMGQSIQTINDLIKGEAPLTPEIALQLERLLGIPARLWNKREQHYREALVRQAEEEPLEVQLRWLDEIPIEEMITEEWLEECEDEIEQLQEVADFFGVYSPKHWREVWGGLPQVLFQKTNALISNPYAVAAWLRKGELDTQDIDCDVYNKQKFCNALHEIRALTSSPFSAVLTQVVSLCAQAGVAVTLIPTLSKMNVSGATRWLSSDRALIQLAPRDDNSELWSCFFHEAGHVFLHSKKEVFLDSEYETTSDEKEQEADQFAAKMLAERSDA